MLIGITGYARHGKDSIANLLVEKFGFTKLGFADAVREMAIAIDPAIRTGMRHYALADGTANYTDLLRAVGYEQAKANPEVRRLLQRIGTEAGRTVLGEDVWVNALARKLDTLGPDAKVVINDVRFENEAKMVRQFGGYLIRVVRPNFDNGLPPLHPSETAIATLAVDCEITAETFDDLLVQAEAAFDHLRVDHEQAQFAQFEEDHLGVVRDDAPRVYLAAPWVHKDEAAAAKQQLIAAGIEVVSGWTERENTGAEIGDDEMQRQAILDRNEVNEANTLIILGLAKSEGKASELGMALGASPAGKRIILVKADRTGNIFYHLPEVERVDTLEEAAILLGANYRMNTTPDDIAFAPGFQRTLDPITGKPLPGTPWDGMPIEDVTPKENSDV